MALQKALRLFRHSRRRLASVCYGETAQPVVEKPVFLLNRRRQPTLPDRELRASDLDRLIREKRSLLRWTKAQRGFPVTTATETPAKIQSKKKNWPRKRSSLFDAGRKYFSPDQIRK